MDDQQTCGKGLAAHAPLPGQLGRLVQATAAVLEAHLGMLDLTDPFSAAEREVYRELIDEHRRAAEVLLGLAQRMAAARELPMGRHVDVPEAMVAMRHAFAQFVECEMELQAMLESRLASDRQMLAAMGVEASSRQAAI